jgi:hypothetical protein
MSQNSQSTPLQHRWQFQVGIACFALPFLINMVVYSRIFRTSATVREVDSALIESTVETAMTISLLSMPLMFVGVVFILFARRRGKG